MLYVAGDSYACISVNQAIGNSWSELLAGKLDTELVNIAIGSVSNTSIAIQLDWISSRITASDYLVVFLTDSYRAALPTGKTSNANHLIQRHRPVSDQIASDLIEFDPTPTLISSIMNINQLHASTLEYYEKWFDHDIAMFQDRMMITGALAHVIPKTTNFVLCPIGFGYKSLDRVAPKAKPEDFGISAKNFLDIDRTQLTKLGWSDITNHMTDELHTQVASMLYSKLIKKTS